jgi:hypothetical protein
MLMLDDHSVKVKNYIQTASDDAAALPTTSVTTNDYTTKLPKDPAADDPPMEIKVLVKINI